MALNILKCNHWTPVGLKGLKVVTQLQLIMSVGSKFHRCGSSDVKAFRAKVIVSAAVGGMTTSATDWVSWESSTICPRRFECRYIKLRWIWSAAACVPKQRNTDDMLSLFAALRLKLLQETHQQMRYPNVTSLNFYTPLRLTPSDGGVPLGRCP